MQATKIFISYSHNDKSFKDELDKHLKPFRNSGLIENWTDTEILPGKEWNNEIIKEINKADIIILLVSIDFFNSDYILNIELENAISRHNSGLAKVIPIILRPCRWQKSSIGKIQALPTNGKAISTWENKDEAFLDVANGIERILDELNQKGRTKIMEDRIRDSDEILGKSTSTIIGAVPSKYGTEGIVRRFLKGSIYLITKKGNSLINHISISDNHQVRINNSNIGICYEMNGGTGSNLGFPLSEIESAWKSNTSTGFIQWFEGGAIYFTERFGASILLNGNIRNKLVYFEDWLKRKENIQLTGGIIGFPIDNQINIKSELGSEGIFQRFEGGCIIDWNIGTFSIYLGFYTLYQSINLWKCEIGFPISDEDSIVSSISICKGSVQYFENGCMIYNQNNGQCYIISGEIYNIWKSQKKKYGFPLNFRYITENQSIQDFEGDVIALNND